MSPHIRRTLGVFHHRVIFRLTGQKPRCQVDGSWVYPPLDMSTEEAGLEEVEIYVTHCHNTAAHFIVTTPITNLCLVKERRHGVRVSHR